MYNDPLVTHYIDPIKKIAKLEVKMYQSKCVNKLSIREGGFNNTVVIHGQEFNNRASCSTVVQEIG